MIGERIMPKKICRVTIEHIEVQDDSSEKIIKSTVTELLEE